MKTKTFSLLATLLIAAQGLWAQPVTVMTEETLRSDVNNYPTVKLGSDITLNNGRLDIVGKTVTLDLNGHTLRRNISAVDAGGQVIMVSDGGKLTITDTSAAQKGTITGGWAYQGGGIFVRASELTIEGGTITGNRAVKDGGGGYGYGGGIEIESGSTMTMTGGTITGNTAEGYGGGIYLGGVESNQASVRLTMTGGSITGNTAGTAGGGIYQLYCTVRMQGSPVVENNSADDYYLSNWGLITVTGAFTSGASIGVCTEWEKDCFTSSYSTYNSGVAPGTYFHVGSSRIAGTIGWNTGNTEAKLTQTGYKYIERAWDSTNKKVTETTKACTSYTAINGSDTSDEGGWVGLYDGWYVVTGSSSYKVLNVQGNDVHLIIPDEVTITVSHVKLELGKKLSIYGQISDTGTLVANNNAFSDAAGIGSGGSSSDGNAGMLNIHGGTIHATGNKYAAGIGGGDNHGFGPQANNSGLYVYGGHVTAQGGEYGAGIGSGDEPSEGTGGYVVVYGGTVNATGGNEAAGIGGGNEGNGAMFSIYGGTVTAQGGSRGAGIGGGDEGNSGQPSFYGGTVTATGGNYAAGIGGGWAGHASYIEVRGGNITATGGAKTGLNTGGGAGIGGGYKGNCQGISFYDGTVNAIGKDGAAGIGGGEDSDYCVLTISGGNITATAEGKGSGLGRGYTTDTPSSDRRVDVSIKGGEVTATSANGGAGIGTGEDNDFYGSISISSGKVRATGYNGGAGIGTGTHISGDRGKMRGSIIISGGEVTAKATTDNTDAEGRGGAGIGSGAAGQVFENGLIQILGGSVTAEADYGSAIGAGGTKMIGTVNTHARMDGSIQISGDDITLNLKPGKIKELDAGNYHLEPVEAIRIDADRGGRLSINGQLAVKTGGITAAENERVSKLQSKATVEVAPCTHGSYTNGHCTYCAYQSTLNISLSDNADNTNVIGENDGMLAASVTLSGRTLYKDGAWNTLCLPFSLSAEQIAANAEFAGVELMTLSESSYDYTTSKLTLNFASATSIEAGVPYIVRWTSGTNISDPVFSYVTINNTKVNTSTEYVDFIGIYSPEYLYTDDKTKLFLGSNNTLRYPLSENYKINSFRGYFLLKNGLTASTSPSQVDGNSVKEFTLSFGDGTTGINDVKGSMPYVQSDSWYSIDGRKLSGEPTQKGIYIHHGKKIIK